MYRTETRLSVLWTVLTIPVRTKRDIFATLVLDHLV